MDTFGRFGNTGLRSRVVALLGLAVALMSGHPGVAQRVSLAMRMPGLSTEAVDTGALPGSTPMQIGLSLAAKPERAAALEQFLADVQTAGSPSYHKWVTPAEFAAKYGATSDQITAVTAWLATQGLSVAAVSAGGTRLTVAGTAAQVEAAFGVGIEQYQVGTKAYFANTSAASLPIAIAPMIVAVRGLDNLAVPECSSTSGGAVAFVASASGCAANVVTNERSAVSGQLSAMDSVAAAIDANLTPVLTLTTVDCSNEFAQADYDAYTALFQQANAQGITVLATSGCGANGAGSFPASLVEVTSVVAPGAMPTANFMGIDGRPDWQSATGLPAGTTRVEPDLTTANLAAFAQAMATIVQQAGTRQGNINATLYTLAPEPGLFTQPDAAVAGTWETATGLGLVDLNALVRAWPKGVSGSQTALTFSSYSVTHGQNLTLTAAVTDPTQAGVPTGTVTFSSTQAGTLASAALVNGTATTSTNTLAGGQYNFSAAYSGDGTYAASTSNTGTVTVQPEPAAISATVAAGAAFGGNMTVTVTVASQSGVGTPTGTVSVQPQTGGASYSGTLAPTGGANSAASASVTFAAPQGGTFNLQIGCSGDASFSCYQPVVVPVTVAAAVSTTTLTLNPPLPTTGSQLTLTATVTRIGSIAPTGTVQFLDGTTVLNTASLNGGSASYTTTFTTGQHSFVAVYSGDTNYAASKSGASSATGGTAATSTSLTSSVYGVTYGQPFTLTSTVQSTAGGGNGTLPTGTITFSAATQGVLGTATLTNGTASFTSPGTLPVGTYVLSAAYSGDANYAASTSTSSNILTISQEQGTLVATISPTTVGLGQTASIAVTVTLPFPGAAPTGTVSANVFGIAGAIYTATLTPSTTTASGTATITIPAPPNPGTYTIQVTCAGTANFSCGTPPNVTLTSTATGGNTSTALAVSSTNPAVNQAITLTATITTSVAGTPTGTVTFYDNGTAIGTGMVSNKQATATVTLAAGAGQNITAAYSGDSTFTASTSAAVTVNVGTGATVPSGTSLTASVTSALKGTNVVFTAQVSGSAVASGTVAFYNTYNATTVLLGTATLAQNGTGLASTQLSTSGLVDGTNSVYAVYLGNGSLVSSTSSSVMVTINDYSVAMSPSSLTLSRGQTGTVTLTVAPVGTFTGKVSFTCVAPASTATTCAISPSSVNGSGAVTMTIGSTAAANELPQLWQGISGVVVALLVWGVGPVRRRRLPVLLLVLLALGITANMGCGSGTASAPASTGSPTGVTLFTIDSAGSDGVTTVTHDYQYQVTLQ